MFGSGEFKKKVFGAIKQLEGQIQDLRKSEMDLRAQNAKLNQIVKNLGRKLVVRLPISLESLEKGLVYDLIFGDEIEAWKAASRSGVILDVRPAHEFARGSVAGSVNIPLDQLVLRLDSLRKDQAILVVCDNGIKSVSACEILNSKGYPFTYVLKGGYSLLKGDATATARDVDEIEEELQEVAVQ